MGISCHYLNLPDLFHGDFGILKSNDIIIYISNSGNTKELIELFPYDFPTYEGHAVSNRQHMVRISLDKETYNKLKKYSELKDMYINRATKELLTKAIKLWEK
jgi:hypothetical protein